MNGLVTPEVARRRLAASEPLRSAGHDKAVPTLYFLKNKPTLLDPKVIESSDPAQAASRIAAAGSLALAPSDRRLRSLYTPDFVEFPAATASGARQFLFVLRRLGPEESANAAHKRFRQDTARLTRTRIAPVLRRLPSEPGS